MSEPERVRSLTVVCDAGPLIHLDELGSLDVLADFPSLLVPDAVRSEVARHRPKALDASFLKRTAAPSLTDTATTTLAVAFSLDAGELECMAVLRTLERPLFLTDDAPARFVAEQLGYRVHGTIGLLVRSIRRGTRTADQVLTLLDEIPERSTLHVQRALLEEVKVQVRQARVH